MKCPHCNETIGVFCRALNRFGRVKICPNCGKGVRIVLSWAVIGICFIPAVLLTLAIRPWVGSFATLPGITVMLLLAMRLKPAPRLD